MPSASFVYHGSTGTVAANLMPTRIATIVYGISPNGSQEEIIFKGNVSPAMLEKILPTATAKGFTQVRITHPEG